MPELVETIDAVSRRLGRPVLMLRFGQNEVAALDPAMRVKRRATLERLAAAGVAVHPCGPPSGSGWLTVLGDVYFEVAYAPGEPAYERLRAHFEQENGELIDPEVRFCMYMGRSDGRQRLADA